MATGPTWQDEAAWDEIEAGVWWSLFPQMVYRPRSWWARFVARRTGFSA